jgi:hypothetical protein
LNKEKTAQLLCAVVRGVYKEASGLHLLATGMLR